MTWRRDDRRTQRIWSRGRPRWRPASSTPTRRPSRRRSAFWRRCPHGWSSSCGRSGRSSGSSWRQSCSVVASAPHRSRREVLFVVAACAPLTLPFAVGLLFGNLDVWFPLLYGVMLLAAIAPGRATAVGGGVALAFAAVKLHPASLGLWFLTRAFRDRRAEGRSAAGLVVATAAVVGAARRRREHRPRGHDRLVGVRGRRPGRSPGHDRRSAECRHRGPDRVTGRRR